MKALLLFITICLCNISKASTYYISPTGSDSNNGSILTPFKSVGKLSTVMIAGDIAYIRGGTYTFTNNAASVHNSIHDLTGTSSSPINIFAYPNELPVFNFSNIVPTVDYVYAFQMINCSYVHLKGQIIIKNLKQVQTGAGISRGFSLSNSNHCTIEWLEIFNMAGTGFIIEDGSADNLILNCDSHHNGDGLSVANIGDTPGTDAWDNADAFSCTSNPSIAPNTSTRNTFRGCRGWLNSDDGWDFFGTNGVNTLDNCWSFWEGVKPWGISNNQPTESAMTTNNYTTWHNNSAYIGSSGEGFKLGPAESQNINLITKYVSNCVSFENRGTGYASNSISSLTTKHQFYNNIAYKNDNDGFSYGAGWSGGVAQIFKNNWAWNNNQLISGGDLAYDGLNGNMSNNVWATVYQNNYGNLYPGIPISNADFLSVSSVGMDGARQTDGSLPVLNFLKLALSSHLINAGVNVGLSYISSAPDLGAFESNGTISNLPPTANAGSDQTIILPINSVSVNGSGTDPDGSIKAYLWTKVSGPTGGIITNTSSASTTITGLVQGAYQFQLTVTDNLGATSTDIVQVIVNVAVSNIPPTANAGADKTITQPSASVSLSGTGTDPDGSVSAYLWTKVSGPVSDTITTSTSAATTVTALVQGVYKFELKVTDNAGAIGKDTIQVTVNIAGNQPPTSNAGVDQTITLPTTTASLSGSGVDVDGSISSYAWSKVSGPTSGTITTSTSAATTVTALTQGIYRFELKVTDNVGATAKDTIQVTVNAVVTANNAYGGVRLPIPGKIEAVNFDNGGQNNAYYDNTNGNNGGLYRMTENVDITTSSEGGYLVGWIEIGEWMKYSVNVASTGIYSIQARIASGNSGTSMQVEMDGNVIATITIPNTGGSQIWQTVTIPNVSLTAGDKVMRIYAVTAGFNINYLTFTATGTNAAPTANAGADQTIILPANAITLIGTGVDNDGTISSYFWTKLSGPTGGSITTTSSASTTVTGLFQGTYSWELKVTDNQGAIGRDTVNTIVNATSSTLNVIRVNIYGRTVYNNVNWNNWKPVANSISSNFKYEDGTVSTVNAVISNQSKIYDNGTSYVSTATICPPAVLRYTSANQGSRIFSIKGLDPTKQYTFDLFASSKVTGNQTVFVINGISYTINTDNNINSYAEFTNISPNSSGVVAVTLNSIGAWNYLSAFTITEQTGTVISRSAVTNNPESETDINTTVTTFPLPFSTSFTVSLYGEIQGVYNLTLLDLSGNVVWKKEVNKSSTSVNETIYVGNLRDGMYILQVISPDKKVSVHKIIKN